MGLEFIRNNPVLAEMFKTQLARVDNCTCPTCGKSVGEFRDDLSRKEFSIAGMCQTCQDEVFGVTLSCKCGKTKPGTPGTLETTYTCGFCKRLE